MTESYTVFARRYRPASFDEVAGQEPVATTLRNAITENRVGHAYLFSGPRGVGKTSMARIFARALDCEKGPTTDPCGRCEICVRIHDGTDTDVIEMDAASNRSVENARTLRDGVRYAPLRARFKIYIIDEAHMLTPEAFNTLLKTLEEPPPHVKFVFATTERHRLPDTITSRCQRFDFRRITAKDIAKRLDQIARKEKLSLTAEVLASVARAGRGSMRDAESLLDQLVAYKESGVTREDVTAILGAAPEREVFALFDAAASADAKRVLETLDRVFAAGVDGTSFTDQILAHLRSLLLLRACGREAPMLDLPDADLEEAAKQAERFTPETLLYSIQLLLEARRRIREGTDTRLVLETTAVKLALSGSLIPLGEALRSLDRAPAAAPAPAPAPSAALPAPAPEPDEDPRPPESVDDIRNRWLQVVDAARARNVLVGTLLGEGRVRHFGADEIDFVLPPKFTRFHVEQIEQPKNRTVVEESLQKVYGKRLAFHASLERVPEPSAAGPVFPTPAARAEGIASDPGVRKVLQAFPGSKIVGIE